MLTNIPVVEILDAKVVQNLKNVGQVQQGEIQSIIGPDFVLHVQVDSEYKNRLYQQVDKEQQENIEQKGAIHGAKVLCGRGKCGYFATLDF